MNSKYIKFPITLVCISIIFIIIFLAYKKYSPSQIPQYSSIKQEKIISTQTPDLKKQSIEVVVQNLDVPWEFVFLPDGNILMTERPGRLLLIGADKAIIEVKGVYPRGEGGLLGLTLHPDYVRNHFIYIYLTSRESGAVVNRVERYTLEQNSLSDRKIIVQDIQGSSNHDGGRIAFGPDGYLYVTTGDAEQPNSAQDIMSRNGKILRVTDEGNIPNDNPFQNAVYSYGHRNVQGITWDSSGRLWATEHGRSGISSGFDELNLIEKGKNYGWPVVQGDEKNNEMVSPIIHSGSNETWAPSGIAYDDNKLFFVGLRGQTLYKAGLNGKTVTYLNRYFQNIYGRLRAVHIGPDGYIYVITNNSDGRGKPMENDDKLLKISQNTLK